MLHSSNLTSVMEARDHFKNGASSKSQMSRCNQFLFKVLLLAFIVVFSGCSQRIIDFTVISSKNHSLQFDLTKGVKAEGKSVGFLGLGTTIKGAMDNALEKAGPGFDLIVDGVVYREDYFFVAGFKVTGTAVRSRELISNLGKEGYLEWLKEHNIFDPATAVVQK